MGTNSSCLKGSKKKKEKPTEDDEEHAFKEFERNMSAETNFFMESAIIKKEDRYFSKLQEKHYKAKFSPTSVLKAVKSKKRRKIKWKEGELIGYGSFGRVILGFNLDNGELMAVKQIISPQFSSSQEVLPFSLNLRNCPQSNRRSICWPISSIPTSSGTLARPRKRRNSTFFSSMWREARFPPCS